ncbi:hypothetical protein GGI42DRAFT_337688 [Trichoderma sp. SZMC 28013]
MATHDAEDYNTQGIASYKAEDFHIAVTSYQKALDCFPSIELSDEQNELRLYILSNQMQALLKMPNTSFVGVRKKLEAAIRQQGGKTVDSRLMAKALYHLACSYYLDGEYSAAAVILVTCTSYEDNHQKEEIEQLTRECSKIFLCNYHGAVIGSASDLKIADTTDRCTCCDKKYNFDDDCIRLSCEHKFHQLCMLWLCFLGEAKCPICGIQMREIVTSSVGTVIELVSRIARLKARGP